jgi:mannosylglycoprotein endo-beta-mannosidase
MEDFGCQVKQLPCTYLGLPLHTRALRRVDFQPLLDKIGGRLAGWKGRFLNKAGRLKLVNMVLTSIPAYFLSVFILKKWAIKRIDRIRRSFLWRGTAEANRGHCLVRWAKVMRPKSFGGLGILDLDLFSRALRLRWLWYEWNEPDRPWVGTELPVNEIDRQLFRASTVVTVGNGLKAEFWNSSWLNGSPPRDVAPSLYRLAWRKRRKVAEELENQSWTRGLWRMSSVQEMAEFVVLWDLVHDFQLSEQPDGMRWRWTINGEYSSKSAYRAQLQGSYFSFDVDSIWKAHAESKHKFFGWLLVQSKLLTTDKLTLRNCPCNLLCPLCKVDPETADHICLHCPFAMQVWHRVSTWSQGLVTLPEAQRGLEDWWQGALGCLPKHVRRLKAAILIYTTWNLWKQRNRRTFENKEASVL